MPCDMAVFDKNDMPRRPICSCKAGLSRIYMMNGRAHFGCSVKKVSLLASLGDRIAVVGCFILEIMRLLFVSRYHFQNFRKL